MIVVSDTTPLRYLAVLGLLDVLHVCLERFTARRR